MSNRKQVVSCLNQLDAAALNALAARESIDSAVLMEEIVRTDCLVLKWEDLRKQARRDQVKDACAALFSSDAAYQARFQRYWAQAQQVQRGFRTILHAIKTSSIGQRSPAEQAWATIYRARLESRELNRELTEQMSAHEGFIDPSRFLLTTATRDALSPSAALSDAVVGVSETLQMLGQVNKWFAADGTLVLPPSEPPHERALYQAGTLMVLSTGWRHVERGWARARFFEASVTTSTIKLARPNEPMRAVDVLTFGDPGKYELYDRIAQTRLNDMFMGFLRDLTDLTTASSKVMPLGVEPVPLAPTAFLSLEEAATLFVLGDVLCLPVESEAEITAGLTLKAWLRGYAYYAKVLAGGDASPIRWGTYALTEQQLVDGLGRAGLDASAARAFIAATTFSRGARDLYDAPLIKSADGLYHFFSLAYWSPTIGNILLSRLGSLGRNFEVKGERFETRIVTALQRAGVAVKSFGYRTGGVDYDCDAAFVLGQTLFVFECKNYGLAHMHIPSLFYFVKKFHEAQEQAKRIAAQFQAEPQLVRGHLGPVKWKRIVPCVVYALPWIGDQRDGVYSYDASALVKLADEGKIGVIFPVAFGQAKVLRRHFINLREGKMLAERDLLRQLARCIQFAQHEGEHEIKPLWFPVADDFGIEIAEWSRKHFDLHRHLRAMGVSEGRIEELARELGLLHDMAKAHTQPPAGSTEPEARGAVGDSPDLGTGLTLPP